ncbi:MAG: hypothetical protein GY940_45860, partial [bacterium]|nr:hypothetical protein [bacterium]
YIIIIGILLVCAPLALRGVGDKETVGRQPLQELFQTETVYPQEKGELQLTLIANFNKKTHQNSLFVPMVIEYGITDNWQVEIESGSYLYKKNPAGKETFGIDVLEIGTKYSFMDISGSGAHVAVGFEIGIPLGHSGENESIDEDSVEYEPFLVLAKDFPHLNHSQLFTEVRLGFGEAGEGVEFNWNSGFFIPVGSVCFTGELNYKGGDEKEIYLTPGMVWNLPGAWELGGGAAIGLNENSDSFRVILTLTYEFDI